MTPRTILIAAGATVALLAAVAMFLLTQEEPGLDSPAAVSVAGADIGGPFELTAHTGETVTAEALIDGPTLLYFGYTFCPDVCPLDAATMAEAVDILEGQGVSVTPVFITVDPERDTPQALAEFVAAMHPRMIGLTGTGEQIRAAADAYKVYYAKAETEEGQADYLMAHSNFLYLMTPEGLEAVLRPNHPAEEVARAAAMALER